MFSRQLAGHLLTRKTLPSVSWWQRGNIFLLAHLPPDSSPETFYNLRTALACTIHRTAWFLHSLHQLLADGDPACDELAGYLQLKELLRLLGSSQLPGGHWLCPSSIVGLESSQPIAELAWELAADDPSPALIANLDCMAKYPFFRDPLKHSCD